MTRSTMATNPKRRPAWLDLEAAAEAAGMTPEQLALSRARGLEPGILGVKRAGVLKWRRSALESLREEASP